MRNEILQRMANQIGDTFSTLELYVDELEYFAEFPDTLFTEMNALVDTLQQVQEMIQDMDESYEEARNTLPYND